MNTHIQEMEDWLEDLGNRISSKISQFQTAIRN